MKSSSQVDRNSEKIDFYIKNASKVVNANYGSESAFTPFEQSFSQADSPKVLVIFEDGLGPKLEEYRVDLPLFLFTDKAYYSGVALPKFKPGSNAKDSIQLRFGNSFKPFRVVTDINDMASLEFESSYSKKVNKQIISAIIKTTAQVALNKELDKKASPMLALLGKVATAGAQAALTRADTRHWTNLPNTINGAMFNNDGSGTLEFMLAGMSVHKVDIPKDQDVIVYARSSTVNGVIQTYLQTLPLDKDNPYQIAKNP